MSTAEGLVVSDAQCPSPGRVAWTCVKWRGPASSPSAMAEVWLQSSSLPSSWGLTRPGPGAAGWVECCLILCSRLGGHESQHFQALTAGSRAKQQLQASEMLVCSAVLCST